MSNIKKFGYADTQLFTLTGGDYTGVYNVNQGNAYIGKYTQEIKLDNFDNAQNGIILSDKFFDRLPGQNFTLTYALSDFIFQPNEFININSFDNKLKKAYTNFLDSYRSCFMASSNLPYNFTGVAKISATNTGPKFAWTSTSNNTLIQPLSVFNSAITSDSKIVYATNIYSENDTLIIANSATIMVYKVYQPDSTFTFTFSSEYIETNTAAYGSLTYGNITSLSRTGNSLYVCDQGNNTIYAYDITNVLNEDKALGYKFNLTDSMNAIQGGFVNASLVASSNNTVYVYDSYTYTIFFYDTNFNLKNSYKNKILFANSAPCNLSYYQIYDELFVLTEDFKLIILDSNANVKIINLSTNGIQSGEFAKKIIFSNIDSNIFYLLTNINLYKKFVSNILQSVGNYSFVNNITGTNTNNIISYNAGNTLYDIDILSTETNVDNILLFGYDQFINYNEVTVYNSLIK